MNDTILFFHLSAKLPGYLFILAIITNPGNIIYLDCSEEKRPVISSMLKQIGLNAQSCLNYLDVQIQKPIILSVYEEPYNITQMGYDAIRIILLPYQYPMKQFEHYAIEILSQYPNHIIINELQDLSDCKTFSVALSKGSSYYDQLNQRIVRPKLTYGF